VESSPRPGYYPDPSVPGYIRYWDGSKWVPGTSKPMPKKAAGGGDAEQVVESGAVPPPPRVAGGSPAFPSADDSAGTASASGRQFPAFNTELPLPPQASQGSASYQESAEDLVASSFAKAPAFAPPRLLSEVSFDDAVASQSPPPPAPSPFGAPRPAGATSFDDARPEAQRPAPPPMPGFPGPAGGMTPPGSQVGSAAGMGISITGAPGMAVPSKQTPAQMSATNQALRIRLLRADGKPFDGPEITTGLKKDPQTPSRTEFDKPRGSKIQKQAPKVVVKTGPLERAGHTLAVLLISAVGIVPLAYLLLRSVHDREDKLAAKITVPTKMNVLDGTSEAYLAGMVVVLLVVTLLYAMRLKRRRER
jgi:uncharacterized protein DUF2510